jgi:hypothetical protein
MNPTTQIKLTDSELVLLDGKVNEEAQKVIEIAKTRLSYTDAFSSIPEPQRTFPVQLPPQLIASPTQPLYTKQSNMKCSKCNWEGHEGEMGKLRTLMGDGWYAGKCPSCGVENTLFSNVIKPTEGYVLTENAPPKPLQVLAAPPTPERV